MEEIARVYAGALYEVAAARDDLDRVRDELGQLDDAMADSRDLRIFLTSPYLSTQEKQDGARRAISDADELLVNLLDVLIENHRVAVLPRVRRLVDERWAEEHNQIAVHITSAVELDERRIARLGEEIGQKTGREVQLSSTVDPDIIGGIVLRVGNSILDASVRSRLDTLRRTVAA